MFFKKSNGLMLFLSFVKWILIGSLVGIFTGSMGALFLNSLEFATTKRVKYSFLLFLLPLGGAFISFLYSRYGKNSSGGNNIILEKINSNEGDIPLRMAPLVFLGTFVTHLLGGSAGREGTGVQIGGCIAEWIGKVLKLDEYDSRIILMSGVSSGFSSVFGTPLAGTIFGLEVASMGTMSYEALIPCFASSIVGNYVTSVFGIHHTHYIINSNFPVTYSIVSKVIFAAILFGLVSRIFSKLTHKLKEVFTKRFKNAIIKSFIGGVLIIILVQAAGTRNYLGLSLPLMSDAFTKQASPFAFLWKLLFTSLTLGTGFQGGEVTPLFVIGSTLGSSLSSLFNLPVSFLAALGLIGVFTGATNTPLASFVMSIELFGSNGMIFMFMTCVISYLFSGNSGIYASQKIGRKKSKHMDIPYNSTLSYYGKLSKLETVNHAESNYKETIRKHQFDHSEIKLSGQLSLGSSIIALPNEKGLHKYIITIKEGSLKLCHHFFSEDGGFWTVPTKNDQSPVMYVKKGYNVFVIDIEENFDKLDKIFLVNDSLFKNAKFTYEVIALDDEVKEA